MCTDPEVEVGDKNPFVQVSILFLNGKEVGEPRADRSRGIACPGNQVQALSRLGLIDGSIAELALPNDNAER